MTPPVDDSRASARRSWIAEIGSLLALAISVIALGVAAYQTRLMQEQARASVWPLIKIGYRISDRGDNPSVAITVNNNGVGPAKIESVRVSLDGVPMHRWEELFSALKLDPDTLLTSEASINGQVQPPSNNRETTIEPVSVAKSDASQAFAQAMPRIAMSICYCSVYDECWIAHFHDRTLEKAAACDSDSKDEFLE